MPPIRQQRSGKYSLRDPSVERRRVPRGAGLLPGADGLAALSVSDGPLPTGDRTGNQTGDRPGTRVGEQTGEAAPPTRVSIRVRYAETDQMGVGYHGAYLPWLEVARTSWLREHALPYRELEATGIHLPVVEVQCRYRQPVRYDDDLIVEASAHGYRRSGIGFEYRVLRARDGALVATAATRHAAVGPGGRARRLPEAVRKALTASREGRAGLRHGQPPAGSKA